MTKSERDMMLRIAVEIDQLKRNVSQRDKMLREQLEKRSREINLCGARKISTARDAGGLMAPFLIRVIRNRDEAGCGSGHVG
jgi:hypothetical protein